jgi:hypothetical protein
MIRKLFLLAAILCFCSLALAKSGLMLGLDAGGAMTDIRGDWQSGAPQKFKDGMLIGGHAELVFDTAPLIPHAALRFEALFSQKGFKDQVHQVDEEGHYIGWKTFGTVHADEVTLSALYIMRISLAGIKPFVEIGPEAGLPLHAKETVELSEFNGSSFYPSYWSKKTNWGINIGTGAAIPLFNGELAGRLRYNYGLTNLFRYSDRLSPTVKIHTKGYELMVGYGFWVL